MVKLLPNGNTKKNEIKINLNKKYKDKSKFKVIRPDVPKKSKLPVKKESIIHKFDEKAINESLSNTTNGVKYNIIYADPPWYYSGGGGLDGVAEHHYNTISLNNLKKIKIQSISDDDCALLMWTTGPQLKNAIELMESWGFTYLSMFAVWVKSKSQDIPIAGPYLGYYTRQVAEYCLLGKKGNIIKYKYQRHDIVYNTFYKERKLHSEKPIEVKEIIEKIFLDVPKIELFARSSHDPKWDYWGNEVTKNGNHGLNTNKIRQKQIEKSKFMKYLKFKSMKIYDTITQNQIIINNDNDLENYIKEKKTIFDKEK